MTASLSKKERMRRALWRQPVDRLPVQTNHTGTMAAKLAAHFGCPVPELAARFQNHLLLLGPSHRMQSDIPPDNVAAMLEAFPP